MARARAVPRREREHAHGRGVPRRGRRHRRAALGGERLIDREARARGWRVAEHFSAGWQPLPDYNADRPNDRFRPFGHTPGHALEWARLLLGLRAALPDPPDWLLEAPPALFDRALADGWDDGFVYTTDGDGTPVVRERMHWVVAEAIGAAATLHAVTGDARYADAETTFWAFAEAHLIDREHGGWRHELDAANRPAATTWSGRPDTYHAFQAALIPELGVASSLAGALAGA